MVKNGKLFGKINIIDLLVILVILAAIAAVAVFLFMPKSGGDTLIMKFRIEEVDEFVAKKVHVGDELYDDTYSLELGYVTDVELDDSISYGEVNDGVYTLTSKEGYYSMIITGEVNGRKTDLGAEIDGEKYGVGHSFVLRAGDAKLYLRVYDIQVKGEETDDDDDTDDTKQLVDVSMSFYANEVEDFVVSNIKTGDEAADVSRKCSFGSVEEITVSDAVVYSENDYGVISGPKDGFNSVLLKTTATGELTSEGVKIDGRIYSVGDEIELRAGSSRFTVKIYSIG